MTRDPITKFSGFREQYSIAAVCYELGVHSIGQKSHDVVTTSVPNRLNLVNPVLYRRSNRLTHANVPLMHAILTRLSR